MLKEFMSEQKIIYETLKNSLILNKLSHAYLFDTAEYNRGYDFIIEFVKCIICRKNIEEENHQCDLCNSIKNGNYPDIEIINPDGLWIKKEQVDNIQIKFSTKSILNNYKIYIINGAEYLNLAAANSILKFLEEPEPGIIAILVTKNINNVLETIKSRCINITFKSNRNLNLPEEEKILNYLFINNKEKEEFIAQNDIIEYMDKIMNFVLYLEKNKIDTIVYTQKLWFTTFLDRTKNMIGYELLLLVYKDVVNLKINRSIDFFSNYKNDLKYIAEKNKLEDLYKKINIILDHKNRNKINVNLNLNLDNMILELGEIL